ncbi:MAG: molybdopterin biosynthesis protein, partial [Erysipelotrichales bacterium]|nr:molybdopterin biosynthesis protein [Erysipelotrichales bacterium]
RLAPPDLGALLAGGYEEIAVVKKPKVAVLPTGDELLPPGALPQRGQLVEFNGTVIAAYITEWGGEPILYPITKDVKEDLRRAVQKALAEADIVLINAGSSAGRDDYTAAIIAEFGQVLVHGVATRPGKPVILGIAEGKPVLGLPGYPVSAYLALDWFGKPLLNQYYRRGDLSRPTLHVKLGKRVVSDLGSEEFIRLTIGYVDGEYIANPLGRGAGMTMTMVQAHGLLVIPANSLGYEQGEVVEVELYQPANTLKHNLLATGSHDLALDFLATAIKEYDPRLSLASAHVGSMGGIMAIRKNEAHIAGVHLLDVKTGQYNNAFIDKYFPDEDVVLVHLAWRIQGFMVAPGNPLDIHTVADLVNQKVSYVNRQKGAGTRLLFDWLLSRGGIAPEAVYGYNREEYTHLNVAAAIAAGSADAGLGIDSAAKAYRLDFIPVGRERYDLLMRRSFLESEAGQVLLKTIRDEKYARQVESMGGYDMAERGKIVYEKKRV